MKNLQILLALICLAFFGCTDSAKKNNSTSSSTETSQYSDTKTPSTSNDQNIYLKGGGNEPGWNIKITKETDTDYSFDLIMNYGEDTYQGVFTSSENTKKKTKSFKGKDENGIEVSMVFQEENCMDENETIHEGTVTLKMNGKSYIGCGDLLKQ